MAVKIEADYKLKPWDVVDHPCVRSHQRSSVENRCALIPTGGEVSLPSQLTVRDIRPRTKKNGDVVRSAAYLLSSNIEVELKPEVPIKVDSLTFLYIANPNST